MRNKITSDLIESIEDMYGNDESFEQIPKGSPGRIDSKKLHSRGDRKKAKEERRARKEGHWLNLEMYSAI